MILSMVSNGSAIIGEPDEDEANNSVIRNMMTKTMPHDAMISNLER